MQLLYRLFLLVILTLMPSAGFSHALDPGYLSLTQKDQDAWLVFWRKPDVNGTAMGLEPVLPTNCTGLTPQAQFDGKAWIADWQMRCIGGLAGQSLRIDGLDATQTDVLVRIVSQDDAPQVVRLTPQNVTYTIPEDFTGLQVFWNYMTLGYEHILEGLDHLLFVFALLLLVQTPRRLIGAVTAFTVAHSITLALASLGVLRVPGPPVEAVIALSITFLALEILKQDKTAPSLTQRAPWIVAFGFGLLHGLGFAGALTEIGLPEGDIPLALLAFNIGVELGQLSFVFAVLALFALLAKIIPVVTSQLRQPRSAGMTAMGYAIGFISLYWLMDRLTGFPVFAAL